MRKSFFAMFVLAIVLMLASPVLAESDPSSSIDDRTVDSTAARPNEGSSVVVIPIGIPGTPLYTVIILDIDEYQERSANITWSQLKTLHGPGGGKDD